MTDRGGLPKSIAVSEDDLSSDRAQSDDDNKVAVEAARESTRRSLSDRESADLHAEELLSTMQLAIASSDRLTAAALAGQERDQVAKTRFRWSMIVLGVLTLVTLVAIALVLISAQRSRTQIADCVKPTGKCYQDNQKRTADILDQAQVDGILRVSCFPDYVKLPLPQRELAITACVNRERARVDGLVRHRNG